MSIVKIPATPLSKSNGSFGAKTETPRTRSRSEGSFGTHVEAGAIPMTSTVNGVTFVVPPGEGEPK